jgi:hypothetical protein
MSHRQRTVEGTVRNLEPSPTVVNQVGGGFPFSSATAPGDDDDAHRRSLRSEIQDL